MANQETTYPCVRCGKPRIVARTWEERIKTLTGFTVVIRTETVCPDVECQRALEVTLADQQRKREAHQRGHKQRMSAAK